MAEQKNDKKNAKPDSGAGEFGVVHGSERQMHWSHDIQRAASFGAKKSHKLSIAIIAVLTIIVVIGAYLLVNGVFILPSFAPSVKSENDVIKVQTDALNIGAETSSLLEDVKNLVR